MHGSRTKDVLYRVLMMLMRSV